jgi:hypothetical protein
MQFSTLTVAVLASTALFSVTSAAGSGGVRGSIDDQTQTRRSLDAVCMANGCRNGCWMPNADGQGTDKCQETGFFGGTQPLTEAHCNMVRDAGLAPLAVWCADIDYGALNGLQSSASGIDTHTLNGSTNERKRKEIPAF